MATQNSTNQGGTTAPIWQRPVWVSLFALTAAVARAEQGNTLSPSMNVKLSNIKVKVSGSYVTEL